MARIEIRTDRPVGTVDERIFGGFIEHLGRCIYGGVFDEGSPLADARGFRTDVLGAVRDLSLRHVRWPGGNFVSGYHWTDGIGPPDDRPRRAELAWRSEEPNRFGTDEFMAWCAAAGVEPVLCLNMGTGTLDEALAWVEYCDGTGDTYWASRRRANGHDEPYRVRTSTPASHWSAAARPGSMTGTGLSSTGWPGTWTCTAFTCTRARTTTGRTCSPRASPSGPWR